jgi:methyl-accepting chemotaxis protein
MEWFRISYHSIGVLIAFIILLVQIIFLGTKKDKTTPTYWLTGVFFGFAVMLFGYILAYSIYHPIGAFHRYFTVFVLFGNASFTGFAYYFPRNIHPIESKIMIPVAFITALAGYLHFVINTFKMKKFYNFEGHLYSFDFGAQTAIVILILFLWPLFVLIRKTIAFSHYSGRLEKWLYTPEKSTFGFKILYYYARFISGWIKFLFPKEREAQYLKTFAMVILLLIVTAITNALNKSGILSYDYYAIYYANSTLIICFTMLMAYINSSGEPTTFMAKLVGISLVTVLLVFGYVSNITLSLAETDYDNQRLAQIDAHKEVILQGEYSKLPENICYIIKKPSRNDIFDRQLELVYTKDPSKINESSMLAGESEYIQLLIKETKEKLAKKHREMDAESLEKFAISEFKKSRKYDSLMETLNASGKRNYRSAEVHFSTFDLETDTYRYEIGFDYQVYRDHMHKHAKSLFILPFIITLSVLLLFPKFFQSSLVKPLNNLLGGVYKVNMGDLDVKVHVKIQDEIGFLSNSFNSMVESIKEARKELQIYAATLEEKVKDRTKEVEEKMQEVQALKVQQDGDYFLTSLLTKPLFINANKSENVKTEFIIKQKKKFEFRNRHAELGGDICITGNLKLGTPTNFKKYTMAMNGDAMGKSMQGAGGSLVMGVVMNSIMARSASNKKILNTTPEQWMRDAYNECNSVFKSFNGTMVLSATVLLIDDLTGDMWYWNAEHPFTILYRDEKADFIEHDMQLRKLGLDSEFEFQVKKFKLQPGDQIIIGSDGKDDIDLSPNETYRTINEDERLILEIVQEAKGQLDLIEGIISSKGNITDDLSLLKVTFVPVNISEIESEKIEADGTSEIAEAEEQLAKPLEQQLSSNPVTMESYERAKDLYVQGRYTESLELLLSTYKEDKTNLRLNKLLGLISFKLKEFQISYDVLKEYVELENSNDELLYYYSIAAKRIGDFKEAIRIGELVYKSNSGHLYNLINLSDLYRLVGDFNNAQLFAEKVLEIDKENKFSKRILQMIKESREAII